MQITKGFKYRIYPDKQQQTLINHQCFIYNQAYNIALNLQQEYMEENKVLKKREQLFKSFTNRF